MGPAMRSASARSASASIRTTFSPMFFMEDWMLANACGEVQLEIESEMFFHCWCMVHGSPLLDSAIPRSSLPVIPLLFGMHPWRKIDRQIARHRQHVWFIERSQVSQLLFRLGAFPQTYP